MEPWMIAIVVKPLALLVLFGFIVLPLELVLRRYWPEGQLKNVLFDRTFRDRRPGMFMVVWFAVMGTMTGTVALYLNFIEPLLGA